MCVLGSPFRGVNVKSYLILKALNEPYSRSLLDLFFEILAIKKTPPRYPSGRVLASSAGGPRFNPQSRTASYQRRYKNGTSSSLV